MSDNNNPHPAHKELLDLVPDEFHNQIIPILKKWDTGVQERFAEIKDEFKDYQFLLDNKIDPEYVKNSVMLASELEQNPEQVLSKINESWELGYVSKDEAEQLAASTDDEDEDYEFDGSLEALEKHPKFKAMQEALEGLQEKYESDKSTQEEQQQLQEYEQMLDEMEKATTSEGKPFNRLFVNALMAQGLEADAALEQYHKVLGEAGIEVAAKQEDSGDSKEEPPEVMGGEGTSGSGVATEGFDAGKASVSELNTAVEEMIKAQMESGN